MAPRRARPTLALASAALFLAAVWLLPGVALAPVLPGGWWTVVLAAACLTPLPLAGFVWLRTSGRYPGKWTRLLFLRPFWYAQLAVLLLPIGAALGMLGGLAAGEVRAGGRWGMAAALAVLAVAAVWGYAHSRALRLTTMRLALPGLPPGLEGLRIAQLSDLHVGPHTPHPFLARVRQFVEAADADLIAVTGDLVDDFARDADVYAHALGDLAAPLGVWVVPGNHDVYADWPAVRARLEQLPLRVLVNASAVVERDGARLAIVGTGDPAGNPFGADVAPRLDDAVRDVPPDAFPIALAHNPALFRGLARRGLRLVLSGHTHWGQFAIPGLDWSLAGVFLEHAHGVVREDDATLVIHPGTGYWGIPFRLGTPPEVLVLELTREG